MGYTRLPAAGLQKSYSSYLSFPATGRVGILYVDESNADIYLWTGTLYELQSGGGGGGGSTITAMTGSDVTLTNGVNVAIPGIAVTLAASKRYKVRFFFGMRNNPQWAFLTWTGNISSLIVLADSNALSSPGATLNPTSGAFGTQLYTNIDGTYYWQALLEIDLTTGVGGAVLTPEVRMLGSGNGLCVAARSYSEVTEIL